MPLDGIMLGYLAAVVLAGGLLLTRVWRGLARTRLARLTRLGEKRRFESVPTRTLVQDPTSVARERAHRSIDDQFTVTRRFLLPFLLLLVVGAGSLPFLEAAPANLVSVLVTVITVFAGVAARPFLENAMAGLVVSSSRVVNLGDTVKIGELYGTIEDITSTHTTIKLWDWRRYVVPNSQMLQSSFLNYSLYDRYIWASVEIRVAYESDVDRVRELAIEHATHSEYFAGGEPPDCWVLGLDTDGVRCLVAAWAKLPSEAWMLGHDIRLGLARSFREEGIRARVSHLELDETRPGAQSEGTGKAGPGLANK